MPADIPDQVVARLNPVIIRVFAAGDFHRVDMRSIAKSAGMSFTTIYKHFQDKEKLLFWFIGHWIDELQSRVLASLDESLRPIANMRRVMEAHFRYYEDNPEIGRIIFMTVPLARWMEDSTYRYSEITRILLALVRAGQTSGDIRADVDPVAVLDLFNAMFNRTFLMWEYRGRQEPMASQVDRIFDLLLHGIGSESASA